MCRPARHAAYSPIRHPSAKRERYHDMWYPLPTFGGIFDAIAHEWLAKFRNPRVGERTRRTRPTGMPHDFFEDRSAIC